MSMSAPASDFATKLTEQANYGAGLTPDGTALRGGAAKMPEGTGYCVKCKAVRKMLEAKEMTMKNGRKMMKGKCEKCGTTMCRILGNSKK